MKERPILFKGELVREILAGTKTQTRRLVDMRVPMDYIGPAGFDNDPECWGYQAEDAHWYVLARGKNERHPHGMISIPCPRGEVGDRLWVRETWRFSDWTEDGYPFVEKQADDTVDLCGRISQEWGERLSNTIWAELSKGRGDGEKASDRKWRPSIHMPRWASRIDLEIVEVRVQRLQEITEEDARAEGVVADDISKVGVPCFSARKRFEQLWDVINGERATWESNPWVWAISFRRVRP